ncbi:MAG TPA: hypothetical protein VH575_21250 [Gemmataceae bacterium]|jgi:hypothetical protein
MTPIQPFWFKQRQCKAEPAGDDNTLKVSGPNLGEAFLAISRGDNNRWRAAVRLSADGPEVAATETEFADPVDAWEAAFELYRTTAIV